MRRIRIAKSNMTSPVRLPIISGVRGCLLPSLRFRNAEGECQVTGWILAARSHRGGSMVNGSIGPDGDVGTGPVALIMPFGCLRQRGCLCSREDVSLTLDRTTGPSLSLSQWHGPTA